MPASVTSLGGHASGPVSKNVGSSRLWPAHLVYATDATGGPHGLTLGRIVVTIHDGDRGP